MKDEKTRKISRRALMPLIRFAAKNRGTIARIKREMDKRTGKTWSRKLVERWLAEDDARWTHPAHGTGILILEIGDEIMAKVERDQFGKLK